MPSPLTLTLVLPLVPALALALTLAPALTLALTVALTLTRSTPSTTASTSQAPYIRLQPLSHTVAVSVTYGCSLCDIRLQPLSHTVAGTVLVFDEWCGYEGWEQHEARHGRATVSIKLLTQSLSPTVAASITYGCSHDHLWLQSL